MKWDQELKVSGASTEVTLITKCCPKKNTKKRPDNAITTFRAIEDFINPLIIDKVGVKMNENKIRAKAWL